MWKHVVANFLTLAVVAFVAIAAAISWAKSQYTSPGPLAQAICVKVESGATFRVVADDLASRGAVAYPYIFKVGADYAGRSNALKAGSYLIRPGESMASIVETLTGSGQSTCGTELNYRIGVTGTDIVVSELDPATSTMVERMKFDPETDSVPEGFSAIAQDRDTRLNVTLVEGATSWQVIDALNRADFLDGESGEVPPEGRMAPQRYEVTRGTQRADLVARMVALQDQTVAELWDKRADDLPYASAAEALVMASIVEKETGIPSERALVASVFINRLKKGMKLQTDPTVIYGLTKGKGILGRGLRQSELRSNTPYNTYVIDGLPPGPIANPGRAAIDAALHPESTDFLYFVADGNGGHVFARTLEEHNENVAKWRRIEADRPQSSD